MAKDNKAHIPAVLAAIAEGASLRTACKDLGFKAPTFLDWVKADKNLAEQYAHARELQAEHYAEQIIEIADTTLDPVKGRLQVDARKWIASKLLPKKYGDKLDLTTDGKALPAPQIIMRGAK